jgi:phosphodiesterase/alkaline phosphatase D-like protein
LPAAGLPAGSQIWYKVGWPELDTWSPAFNFTTYNATDNFPFVVGVVADMGTSYNGSQTMRQLERTNPPPKLIINMGDMSYAGAARRGAHGGGGLGAAGRGGCS